VDDRTSGEVRQVLKSHVNFVVADTNVQNGAKAPQILDGIKRRG